MRYAVFRTKYSAVTEDRATLCQLKSCQVMYKPGDNTTLTIVRLQHCIMDIYHWMSANRLKLNLDKTELIWTGTKYSVSARYASFLPLRLGADVILPSQHVPLLGVVISADLGPEKHVLNVSATCFCHLRRLRHIRRSLSAESGTTLVHAFVTSRINTVMLSSSGLRSLSLVNCNQY